MCDSERKESSWKLYSDAELNKKRRPGSGGWAKKTVKTLMHWRRQTHKIQLGVLVSLVPNWVTELLQSMSLDVSSPAVISCFRARTAHAVAQALELSVTCSFCSMNTHTHAPTPTQRVGQASVRLASIQYYQVHQVTGLFLEFPYAPKRGGFVIER